MHPDVSLKLLVGLCLLFQLHSCTMREAGCLDINATNFDLNAEKDCDACCTYPLVSIVLSQKWDTTNFSITDTFYDRNNNAFLIEDIRYFLTQWSWNSNSGDVYSVDSVEAVCNESPFIFYPDILIIQPQRFSYPIGTIRIAPAIDSIQFNFGLTEDLSCLDPNDPLTPAAVTSASPLWNPKDGLLYSMRLIIDRNLADTLVDTLYFNIHRSFNLAFPHDFKKGQNASLPLTVNYAAWFREADVLELESWLQSILNGLEGSFYQTP